MDGRGSFMLFSLFKITFWGWGIFEAESKRNHKKIINRKLMLGIADGKVLCDKEIVFEAFDIRVGLFREEKS